METGVRASSAHVAQGSPGRFGFWGKEEWWEQLRGGGRRGRGQREGWGICCHGERFSKQLLICLCSGAPPFPFFSSFAPALSLSPSLSVSLSPSCALTLSLRPSVRQPFRQEICSLRVRLWTFLLQSFYAVRHTQGWESLSAKHQERILAGKENPSFTVFTLCMCVWVWMPPPSPILPPPPCPSLAALHYYKWAEPPSEDKMRLNGFYSVQLLDRLQSHLSLI